MSATSAYRNLAAGVSKVASAAERLGTDLAGFGSAPGPWYSQLQRASFRGVPFGVLSSDSQFGRRVAVHEYPYRDSVWVEDLGRAPRRISLIGFLVEDSAVYGGGSVLTQRDQLQRACEGEGEGELVHPTLGRKSVALLRFRIAERRDLGRVCEIAFQFVEAGRLLYPGSVADRAAEISGIADALGLAAVADFVSTVGTLLREGGAVLRQIVGTVSYYVRTVERYINDATNLYNAIRDLPGEFGRFFRASGTRSGTTLPALKKTTATARGGVSRSAATVTRAAAVTGGDTAGNTATAIAAHVSAAAAAAATPADRIRLLLPLATDSSVTAGAGVPVAALYRRAAIAELARAAAGWEPASYNEAVEVRDRLRDVIDAEIVRAGDGGEDATYLALRQLRAALVADLTERAADLARLVSVITATPQPALVLAQRLYQDPARADELVREADPIHPAFMPTAFRALAE
ncbi:DNA circularization N-terminal domain-containing protein [Azospirillum sp. TSH64]|uniref:DNA circularization protein n=1 Tax=Azospirillum sp. TSH64 TaxID=652740 RepID=UPI000D6445C7|nr:DNA circularization N-terminal domain-containing protein [Azospirillum sp. TSH64]